MIQRNDFQEVNESTPLIKCSYYKNLFKTTLKSIPFIVSIIVLITLFVLGFVIDNFTDANKYMSINLENKFISPNLKYLFGTNDFGQDLFYQIFIGCYNTLKLAFLATLINLIVGVIIGVIWGSSSKFDTFMLFIKSIFDNIPIMFFYIIIVAALGNNMTSLLIVIGIFGWVNIACLIRNNLILIRNKDYNIASKLFKTPFHKRALNNYLPSILPIVFNSIALSLPEVISFEIAVSYYGFSIGSNNISLGKLLHNSISNNNCFNYPYLFFIPFAFLFIINMCFYHIGKTISSKSMKEGETNVKS